MRVRARTEALRAECLRLRLQSVHKRRENLELRTACTEVSHVCRATIEQSKVHMQPRMTSKRRPMDLDLASVKQKPSFSNCLGILLLNPKRACPLKKKAAPGLRN
jgi:hypothetical protein